jgi:type I restriction enzyme, R subunit
VVDNLEELEFTEHQLKKLKEEVTHYHNASKEVELASGDYVDLKKYEADMRYIIDNYISAESSKVISTFEDMTLIELILERGVEFIDKLPERMRNDKNAAAEAIENNVRKVIVANQATNPLYYEKMSELLMKIIEDRKQHKEDYKDYLERIVELTKKIKRPEDDAGYPERIKDSAPLRALFDNYSEDEEFIVALHEKIMAVKPDKWQGDKAKEKVLLRGIYEVVDDYDEVDKVFGIVKEQKEYY